MLPSRKKYPESQAVGLKARAAVANLQGVPTPATLIQLTFEMKFDLSIKTVLVQRPNNST